MILVGAVSWLETPFDPIRWWSMPKENVPSLFEVTARIEPTQRPRNGPWIAEPNYNPRRNATLWDTDCGSVQVLP